MPKKCRQYFEKNALFEAWTPKGLYDFFEDYLQHYCQGNTRAARFRVFLYELKSLKDRGITIANPIKAYDVQRREEIKGQFGTTDPKTICLRGIKDIDKKTERDRNIICQYCKDRFPNEFKACSEIKADLQKELDKDGLVP